MRQHRLTSATSALLLLGALRAEAEGPTDTRLVYAVPPIAVACPSERALIDAIAARLGRDPFKAYAERMIRVVIVPGDQYGARIELYDAKGLPIGAREIGPVSSCAALEAPLAVAIALALDPLVIEPPPPPPPPPPIEPRSPRLVPYLSGAALIAIGTLPAATPGARIEGGIAAERWSAGLEGRVEAPASKTVEGGEISAFILAAGASGCFRYQQLEACLVGVAGGLWAQSSGLVGDRSDQSGYATIGARARYVVPVSRSLSVALAADLAAVATQIEVVDGNSGADYWTTPVVHGILALEGRMTPFAERPSSP